MIRRRFNVKKVSGGHETVRKEYKLTVHPRARRRKNRWSWVTAEKKTFWGSRHDAVEWGHDWCRGEVIR